LNRHGKKNTGHSCREIVLSQNEAAEKIHKDLFLWWHLLFYIRGQDHWFGPVRCKGRFN